MRRIPYVLLLFYAVALSVIDFEDVSPLVSQRMGKPTMFLLNNPLYLSNVVAPLKWTHLGLLKVRDFALSGPK